MDLNHLFKPEFILNHLFYLFKPEFKNKNWCKVVCSATHPQNLHECYFCSVYQNAYDFCLFIMKL